MVFQLEFQSWFSFVHNRDLKHHISTIRNLRHEKVTSYYKPPVHNFPFCRNFRLHPHSNKFSHSDGTSQKMLIQTFIKSLNWTKHFQFDISWVTQKRHFNSFKCHALTKVTNPWSRWPHEHNFGPKSGSMESWLLTVWQFFICINREQNQLNPSSPAVFSPLWSKVNNLTRF